MSSNRAKSVRFAEGGDGNDGNERPKKRPRSILRDNDDSRYRPVNNQQQQQQQQHDKMNHKKKKKDRINEDEMDDVDDWEDDEEKVEGLPSEKERLEARRTRREQREHGGAVAASRTGGGEESNTGKEPTRINDTTSLATEGIEIEPFHMENERSDGTGYFDGDTYVFRKRNADEEPDAWLESLKDDDANNGAKATTTTKSGQASFFTESSSDSERSSSDAKVEAKSKGEWYGEIIPLLSSANETIMQAVVRYGQLLKRQPLMKRNRKNSKANAHKQESTSSSEDNTQSESFKFAQKSLNDLTGAANALLALGDVDIYQKTQNDLLKLVPKKEGPKKAPAADTAEKPSTATSKVLWEYKGSQDGQIHGPYSGEQMKAWIRAGYFVGAQAVQIRTVREKEKSDVDDLLSDLMDDDDDENKEQKSESSKEIEYVRGEWQSSDKVDYDAT